MASTVEQSVAAIKKQLDDFFRVVQQSGNKINLAGELTVTDGISYPGRYNLLTNGGVEIWQRGNGPFSTSGAITADGWQIDTVSNGTGTLTVTKETTTIDGNGTASAKLVATVTSGQLDFQGAFSVENALDFYGKTITLSIRVKSSVANAVRPWLWDDSGGGAGTFSYGSYHTGDGTWQTLTVTATIHPEATYGFFWGLGIVASGTFYADNAMLVHGSVPATYAPLPPTEELLRCLRHYERIGGSDAGSANYGSVMRFVATGAGQTFTQTWPFKVTKPVQPTVTINGTWQVLNCGQWSNEALQSSEMMATFITATAAGIGYIYSGANTQFFEAVA